MTFKEKLKEARLAKGLTQNELAELVNVKHNTISDWERGRSKPDPDSIELLCGALDISPSFLLSDSSSNYTPKEESIIRKYRKLDEHGKELVNTILDKEYLRSIQPDHFTTVEEAKDFLRLQKKFAAFDAFSDNDILVIANAILANKQ